ncbi:MAG TPA: chemotaxis protein CheW [Candidatus Eisenbacteria bacterium]|nr:chemotaxis protein CheW [Candidatus Eisenbacteria bacterium]
MGTMDEGILREFLSESLENAERVEQELVALEREPGDLKRIAVLFRAVHSIKGTCGFFGFTKLAAVTHAGENLLGRLRSGERAHTPEIANALLALVDAVRTILARIESTQEEGDDAFEPLIARLNRLDAGEPEPAAPAPAAPSRPDAESIEPPIPLESAAPLEASVRIDVHLLDRLMNLVGELVLARNQLLLEVASSNQSDLPATAQRLNHVTTELQEQVMKTRMQPIGNLWNKLPRLARDVAADCGKHVRLDLEGAETELDRSIIEAMRDPITHVVRNAIDHGIESPAERAARGKPAEGRLLIRAFHEGGKVHVEIIDDGAGLSVDRIRERALRQQLVTPERASRMSDRDWANVIFVPGFSTADRVTSISGRGVGMDVVKNNVERIGGAIEVESRPGNGTTIRIRIPLTLAIVPALIVTAGQERYAIPQVNLTELIRVEESEAAARMPLAFDAPVLRYRDGLLPLIDLRDVLRARSETSVGRADGAISIAVLHADGVTLGLVVDSIVASQEIVVKPLIEPLRQIAVFAGATILGDGAVALILDVPGLARHAGISVRSGGPPVPAELLVTESPSAPLRTLVLCHAGERWTVAVPQEQIARLEEIPRRLLERVGDRAMVQYRGGILPLVSLGAILDMNGAAEAADAGWLPERDPMPVVVHQRGGHSLGLVVESIVEIVEERMAVAATPGARPGFSGAVVVRGSVTELLDLQRLLDASAVGRELLPLHAGKGA